MNPFDDLYFGQSFLISPEGPEVDLGKVLTGTSQEFEIVNNVSSKEGVQVSLPLEDDSFTLSFPGGFSVSSQASLANIRPVQGPFGPLKVTLTFDETSRNPVQNATLTVGSLRTPIVFERQVIVDSHPQRGVTETLEFSTVITEAWDGTEQRVRTRAYPRSEVFHRFVSEPEDRTSYMAELAGMPHRRALVPMFHRSLAIGGLSANGVSGNYELTRTSGDWDRSIQNLKQGDLVALLKQGTDEVQVRRVSADSTATTVFVDILEEAPEIGDLFLPLESCIMADQPSLKAFPTRAVEYETKWKIDSLPVLDSELLNSSTGYAGLAPEICDFDARPILRAGVLQNNQQLFQSESGAIVFDRGIGIIDAFIRKDVPSISLRKYFDVCEDEDELENLRSFLIWAWGRQRSFYVPTEMEEFVYIASAGSSIALQVMDYGTRADFLDGLRGIELTDINGNFFQHEIVSLDAYDSVTGNAQFTLSSPVTIALGEVAAVGALYHVRMASDRVTLNYQGRNSTTCEFRVVTIKQ